MNNSEFESIVESAKDNPKIVAGAKALKEFCDNADPAIAVLGNIMIEVARISANDESADKFLPSMICHLLGKILGEEKGLKLVRDAQLFAKELAERIRMIQKSLDRPSDYNIENDIEIN